MHEYVGNPHVHTPYSDGHASHEEVAQAALQAGLDFVIVTDHNVYVQGLDGYRHQDDMKRVLLFTGEEIHDSARDQQKNHLLVYGARKELAPIAADLQELLKEVRRSGGISFLAHPTDPKSDIAGQPDISWEDWEVDGYTGLELWNFMSEFKSMVQSRLVAIDLAYRPARIATGPFPQTLSRWDGLLAKGHRISAIGGSDAHGFTVRWGLLKRLVFPYEFLFRTINTHVLLEKPLRGDAETDQLLILDALRRGRSFVGYDLPAPTRGFRFSAHSDEGPAQMGDLVRPHHGVTLQVYLPQKAGVRLLRDGELVEERHSIQSMVKTITQTGAYRVEAYVEFEGKRRGWVFSNPIYVRR